MRFLVAVLLLAGTARAQMPVRLVPVVPLDGETPQALAGKLDELLQAALSARGDVRLILPPREGDAAADRVTGASEALARGRAAYARFQFAEAARAFDEAAARVEDAGLPPSALDALAQARIEAAMALAAGNDEPGARVECERLMAVRPQVAIDRVRVPPKVVALCEQVRKARTEQTVEVTVTSTPPLAKLIVDGVTRGTTPLTLKLPVGRHFALVTREERAPVRHPFEVRSEGGRESVQIDLRGDATEELERALSARLRQRGRLAETLAQARALGGALSAERVLLAGVERGGPSGFRVTAAAVDVANGQLVERVVTTVGGDLADAADVAAGLAARLVGPAEGAAPRLLKEDPAERARLPRLDWDQALFGAEPPTVVTVPTGLTAPPPERSRRRLAIGLGVGGGLAVAVGLALGLGFGLHSDAQPDQWMIHVPAH